MALSGRRLVVVHPRLSQVAVALVVAVSSVVLAAGPTQASTSGTDVERVQHAGPGRSTAATFPSTVNSDVYAYELSAASQTYFVVAGHLTLKLRSGSSTAYTGRLVDYSGNKVYKATASTANSTTPVLTFASANGSFTFASDSNFGSSYYTGTGRKVPKTLHRSAAKVTLNGTTHSARTVHYNYVMTERVGPPNAQIEYAGTLTMIYDANFRISGGVLTYTDKAGRELTSPLVNSGFCGSGYFYTEATIRGQLFGLSASISGTNFTGNAFATTKTGLSQWVLMGSAA